MTEETNIEPAGDIEAVADEAVVEAPVEVVEEEVLASAVEPEQVIVEDPTPEPMPEPTPEPAAAQRGLLGWLAAGLGVDFACG